MTRFIDEHRARFGVEPICRELQVAPSAYYAARRRRPSARQVRNEALRVKLRRSTPGTSASTARASSGASCSARVSPSPAAPCGAEFYRETVPAEAGTQ